MKHYVRTAHGDLETYYSGSNKHPLQGGGQGNGAAGPMLIPISIILLNIIATVPINATLISAITLTTLTLSAIMYVNDTALTYYFDSQMYISQQSVMLSSIYLTW